MFRMPLCAPGMIAPCSGGAAQVASSMLGMGPSHAMATAERLYIQVCNSMGSWWPWLS
jgi:hypothetical protein